MRKIIKYGEILPRFYGVAWVRVTEHTLVAYPVPLNVLFRIARDVWMFLKSGGCAVSSNPRAAYNEGYAQCLKDSRDAN